MDCQVSLMLDLPSKSAFAGMYTFSVVTVVSEIVVVKGNQMKMTSLVTN